MEVDSPEVVSVAAVVVPGRTLRARLAIFYKHEIIFMAAWGLAGLSMLFIPPSPAYFTYIDFKVLGCLFALMMVVAGFRSIHLFDLLAYRMLLHVHSPFQVATVLVGITFFSSMWITNDVALLTFVPFTLVVFSLSGDQKPILLTVILQTVAANIGSSLTPMGNPQNLFMYTFYHMTSFQFFSTMLPMVFSGAILLGLFLLFIKNGTHKFSLSLEIPKIVNPFAIFRYVLLFIIALLAVFDVIPWYYAVVMVVLGAEKQLLKKIDYSLLLTFVGLFIFVGNLGALPPIKLYFEKLLAGRVFLTSIVASQLISNVPATFLLSHFTQDSRQLLLGVNVGGCGTLIASLASVISFKIYAKFNQDGVGKYLGIFSVVNGVFLLLFIMIWIVQKVV